MGRATSDDFAGLAGGASVSGRTTNNALGGGIPRVWSGAMVGNSGGIKGTERYQVALLQLGTKGKLRIRVIPPSTSAIDLFSIMGVAPNSNAGDPASTAVGISILDWDPNTLRMQVNGGTVASVSMGLGSRVPLDLELSINGTAVEVKAFKVSDGLQAGTTLTYTLSGVPTGTWWGVYVHGTTQANVYDNVDFDNLDSTSATAGSPTLVHTTGANGTGSVTVNKTTGRVYGLVSTASSMLAADVIANGQSQAVVASGAQAFTFTGVLVGGVNYAYYVYDDGAGNISTVAKSAGASVPVLVPPKIASVTVNPVDQTVVVTIVPDGTGGTITSAAASLAAVSGGAVNQGPSAAVFSGGNWIVTFTGVPFGVYGPATGTATGPDGMDSEVSSAGFSLIDPQGEPEIPDIEPPVIVAPTITTQPQSQSVQVGQSAAFSVEATNGGGVLEYQWHVDGIDVPGEIASTYETDPVTLLDNGREIGVFVSNSAGGLESALATLTVTEAPAPGPTSSYKISASAYFALQRRRAKYA